MAKIRPWTRSAEEPKRGAEAAGASGLLGPGLSPSALTMAATPSSAVRRFGLTGGGLSTA